MTFQRKLCAYVLPIFSNPHLDVSQILTQHNSTFENKIFESTGDSFINWNFLSRIVSNKKPLLKKKVQNSETVNFERIVT